MYEDRTFEEGNHTSIEGLIILINGDTDTLKANKR